MKNISSDNFSAVISSNILSHALWKRFEQLQKHLNKDVIFAEIYSVCENLLHRKTSSFAH